MYRTPWRDAPRCFFHGVVRERGRETFGADAAGAELVPAGLRRHDPVPLMCVDIKRFWSSVSGVRNVLSVQLIIKKEHFQQEIKRTAQANRGTPLGWRKFAQETGIRDCDWIGKH
jgi:hypothetical protein